MVATAREHVRVWTREELEAMNFGPTSPKIRETIMKGAMDPTYLDHLEVGEEGLWVAMHGEEIAATDSSLRKVSQLVAHYGPDEILLIHLEPETDDEDFEIY